MSLSAADSMGELMAIASGLARGLDVRSAVAAAQSYIALAIQTAPAVGKGRRPLNHFPEGFVPPEARR